LPAFEQAGRGKKKVRPMRIGAFELQEPLPELREPHVIAMLRPWVDVNNAATLTLDGLEAQFQARPLAKLVRPGNFFDFTRYRPTLYFEGSLRKIKIPNATLSYATRSKGNDFLFLRLYEPHALAEIYVDSILKLFRTLGVKRYCQIGSMLDAVPHTRPLLVSGRATGKEAEEAMKKAGVYSSSYQGPTSITYLITQKAPEMGMETLLCVVSLPQYVNVEEDYVGKVRLMEVLNSLYDIPIDPKDFERAARQRSLVNQKVESTPELKKVLPQLESIYKLRMANRGGEHVPGISSAMEQLFWEADGDGQDIGKA
jgi:hypothetical protein